MFSRIARGFDGRALKYDNPLTAFIGERELRQIRPLIPPGSQVLDFGCGSGRTTLDLLRRGCTVTAYDISVQMLLLAQEKAEKLGLSAEFTSGPTALAGRAWPFVACIGVLDYYPDPLPLLQTLRLYLEPGGRLVVTFPNALNPQALLYGLASRWTVPATPRTPRFARRAVQRAGYRIDSLAFAFPSLAPFGHTLVMALSAE